MKKSDIFFESERNLRKTGILDTVLENYPVELFLISIPVIFFIIAAVLYSATSKKILAVNLGALGFITLMMSIFMIAVLRLL